MLLSVKQIFGYFHILSAVFCLCVLVAAADISYRTASVGAARYIGRIGTWSYCIYLLHMQIVQGTVLKIPDGVFKLVFAPFIGLALMVLLIGVVQFICNKLPFGDKVKKIVGL